MRDRIRALCEQLLRAEDITVLDLVAEQLQESIMAHIEQMRESVPASTVDVIS